MTVLSEWVAIKVFKKCNDLLWTHFRLNDGLVFNEKDIFVQKKKKRKEKIGGSGNKTIY